MTESTLQAALNVIVLTLENARGEPMEDYARAGEKAFAVADGVSLDRYRESDFECGSGAARAARLFCDIVAAGLEIDNGDIGIDRLARAFRAANWEIAKLNAAEGVIDKQNFLDVDLFGAVGAAAYFSSPSELHFGYVGDCGVRVAGPDGRIRFRTANDIARVADYQRTHTFASRDEQRRFVRGKMRNNPSFVDEGGFPAGYGVFTGEPGVEAFFRFGRVDLRAGDTVLVFTDGVLPLLEMPEVMDVLLRQDWRTRVHSILSELSSICVKLAIKDPMGFGDDRALIAIRTQTE